MTVAKDVKNTAVAIEELRATLNQALGESPALDAFEPIKKRFLATLKGIYRELAVHPLAFPFADLRQAYDYLIEQERIVMRREADDMPADDEAYFPRTGMDKEIRDLLEKTKAKMAEWRKKQASQRREAVQRQEQLLDRLRVLIAKNAQGEAQNGLVDFKEIQEEWNKAAAVANSGAYWASYHALVDQFYDQRDIHSRLREFDQRKNLDQKNTLCKQAEGLAAFDDLRTAMSRLDELHQTFRRAGPVPPESREAVWNRFKAASDVIRSRWVAHIRETRMQLQRNREHREKLLEEIQPFASFESVRADVWQEKTKAINALKKAWEEAVPVGRQRSELPRSFWTAYQYFFRHRRLFFKDLEDSRTDKLKKREELLRRAERLRDAVSLEAALIDEVKKLQHEWNSLGPTLRGDKLTNDFRAALDALFDQRREQHEERKAHAQAALEKRLAICGVIERLAADTAPLIEQLDAQLETYEQAGPPPYGKAADDLEARFHRAVRSFLDALPGLSAQERGKKYAACQLIGVRGDPRQVDKLGKRAQELGQKIRREEHQMAVFQNNLDSFGRSRGAEMLKVQLSQELTRSQERLTRLKAELKLLKSALGAV